MGGPSNSATSRRAMSAHAHGRLKIGKLLCSNSENFLALNLYFDAERRAEIGALHNAAAHPDSTAGKIGGFERVKHRAAAGVSDHGMLRGAEAVIIFQLVQVGEVFELAISERGFLLEGPVAACLGRRACRQTNEKRGDVFSSEAVANEKLSRGPRSGHLRRVGDPGLRIGGMREQSAWIGRRRGNLDLRLLFSGLWFHMFGAKGPSCSQENDEEHGKKSN